MKYVRVCMTGGCPSWQNCGNFRAQSPRSPARKLGCTFAPVPPGESPYTSRVAAEKYVDLEVLEKRLELLALKHGVAILVIPVCELFELAIAHAYAQRTEARLELAAAHVPVRVRVKETMREVRARVL